MLNLNLMPASCFKHIETGAKKTGKVVECSKNTCLEHITGNRYDDVHDWV